MTENQKGKITLGFITSWGLSGLFLLAGIACIADPNASGAVVPMLLIALLLLPPVRGFVHQKTGKSLSMSLRIVCVLILMGFAAAAMPQTNSLESSVATINNAATTLSATSASSPAPEVNQPSAPAVAATQPQGQKGLVVEHFTLQMDSYGVGKVVGTVKNNTKPRALFPSLGLTPETDYKVLYSGKHDNSVMGVSTGDYDAAPVASDVFKRMAERGQVKADDFRIIYRSELFPTSSFAYAHDLEPVLRDRMLKCFYDFRFTPEMQKAFDGADRFVPITYLKDWAIVRKVAEGSGEKFNRAAFDDLSKKEAAAAAKKASNKK